MMAYDALDKQHNTINYKHLIMSHRSSIQNSLTLNALDIIALVKPKTSCLWIGIIVTWFLIFMTIRNIW